MKDVFQYLLDPEVHAFVAHEAESVGVAESDIVTLAIGLLAHYRSVSLDGGALLLTPPTANAAAPFDRLHATAIPGPTNVHVAQLLETQQTYELAVPAPDGRPQLHLLEGGQNHEESR